MLSYCHSNDLITTSEGPTCIHHSKNSETATYWCYLKQDHALKSHTNEEAHINQWVLFCQQY